MFVVIIYEEWFWVFVSKNDSKRLRSLASLWESRKVRKYFLKSHKVRWSTKNLKNQLFIPWCWRMPSLLNPWSITIWYHLTICGPLIGDGAREPIVCLQDQSMKSPIAHTSFVICVPPWALQLFVGEQRPLGHPCQCANWNVPFPLSWISLN